MSREQVRSDGKVEGFSQKLIKWAFVERLLPTGDILENANRKEQFLRDEKILWMKHIARNIARTPDEGSQLVSKWLSSDSSAIFIDVPTIRHLITMSYVNQVQLEGPGALDYLTLAELLNERSQAIIGNSLFEIDDSQQLVQYVGLGGSR